MRIVAGAGVALNLVVCLWALLKGFHIEGTDRAIAEAQQGQRMAIASVPGLVLGLVALGSARFRAPAAICSLALAVVGVLLATS